jgi:hypothetical protein
MMLAIGLSYIAFIMLRYIPSIPGFLWCWILSKAFYASIEMNKWFLYLLLLIWHITFIDLHMLNHPCIPRMKLTWSSWMFFWYVVGFGLPLFYWGFLHWYLLWRLTYSLLFWMCLCPVLGWV